MKSNIDLHQGENEIQWTNMIIFKKDYMSFFPKFVFMQMNFGIFFLQFVIIHSYSCPSLRHVYHFE
jgi:hypothetical protein